MDSQFLYGFLAGVNIGRFTNLLTSVIISGVTLYVYDPDIYRYENLELAANTTMSLVERFRTF